MLEAQSCDGALMVSALLAFPSHALLCSYNDLVSSAAKTDPDKNRAILGKAGGGTISYPRRLRTGRQKKDQYGNEYLDKGSLPAPTRT